MGFLGLFFSPGRGLLWYSPILLFAAGGWFAPGRERGLIRFLLAGVVLTMLGLSPYTWWGGWTYGPRYFADFVPVLVFAMATAVGRLNVPGRVVFGALGVFGVWIQIIGAFFFPRGATVALEELWRLDWYPPRLEWAAGLSGPVDVPCVNSALGPRGAADVSKVAVAWEKPEVMGSGKRGKQVVLRAWAKNVGSERLWGVPDCEGRFKLLARAVVRDGAGEWVSGAIGYGDLPWWLDPGERARISAWTVVPEKPGTYSANLEIVREEGVVVSGSGKVPLEVR